MKKSIIVPLSAWASRVELGTSAMFSSAQKMSNELRPKRAESNMTDMEKEKFRQKGAQDIVSGTKKEKTYKLSLRGAQVDLHRGQTEADNSDSDEEETSSVNTSSPSPSPNPPGRTVSSDSPPETPKSWSLWKKIGLSVVGGVAAVAAAPVVLGAVGFSAGGIVAGSFAAQAMSAAAIANGGTVAAGSAVAICQSVGAAGLGLTGAAAVGTTAAGTTLVGITAVEKLTEKDK